MHVLVIHGSETVHSWVVPPKEHDPPAQTLMVTKVFPSQWACSQIEPVLTLVVHTKPATHAVAAMTNLEKNVERTDRKNPSCKLFGSSMTDIGCVF